MKLLPRIHALFAADGILATTHISRSPQHAEELAASAAANGAPIVVALGGDGLVHMVVNGLAGTQTALAVIPGGTGDDFIRALGIRHRKPEEAAKLLINPQLRSIDAGRIRTDSGERWFINIANTGFDAEVTAAADRMRIPLGATLTYLVATMKTLRRFEPLIFTVQVDDAPEERLPAMLLALGNGTTYGGGMRVTPGAMVDDGEFEACIVRAMGRVEFVLRFPKVYRGTHVTHPKVAMLHGRTMRVSSDRTIPLYADGEAIGVLPASIEIVPDALRVVAPGPGAGAAPEREQPSRSPA